jgi:hypothetical protein
MAGHTLSERHNNNNARIAGNNACSNFNNNNVDNTNRFRAVFRPNNPFCLSDGSHFIEFLTTKCEYALSAGSKKFFSSLK